MDKFTYNRQSDPTTIATISVEDLRNKNAYVWCCGKNRFGELSLGVLRNAFTPQISKNLGDKKVKQISSGGSHTCVVTEDGTLLICGSYLHGKLGSDVQSDVTKFIICPAMSDK